MTRYSQAEKMEIIRMVETSELSVKQTLAELAVPRSTFYGWYQCYRAAGYDGLAPPVVQKQQFWNRIPDSVREHVVDLALEKTEMSPRQLAWHITDTEGYFISESSDADVRAMADSDSLRVTGTRSYTPEQGSSLHCSARGCLISSFAPASVLSTGFCPTRVCGLCRP